jgi:hypothetical protein
MFSLRPPGVGVVVKLQCDPARQKARFVRDDPAIDKNAAEKAQKALSEAERHAPPGTSAP